MEIGWLFHDHLVGVGVEAGAGAGAGAAWDGGGIRNPEMIRKVVDWVFWSG